MTDYLSAGDDEEGIARIVGRVQGANTQLFFGIPAKYPGDEFKTGCQEVLVVRAYYLPVTVWIHKRPRLLNGRQPAPHEDGGPGSPADRQDLAAERPGA